MHSAAPEVAQLSRLFKTNLLLASETMSQNVLIGSNFGENSCSYSPHRAVNVTHYPVKGIRMTNSAAMASAVITGYRKRSAKKTCLRALMRDRSSRRISSTLANILVRKEML